MPLTQTQIEKKYETLKQSVYRLAFVNKGKNTRTNLNYRQKVQLIKQLKKLWRFANEHNHHLDHTTLIIEASAKSLYADGLYWAEAHELLNKTWGYPLAHLKPPKGFEFLVNHNFFKPKERDFATLLKASASEQANSADCYNQILEGIQKEASDEAKAFLQATKDAHFIGETKRLRAAMPKRDRSQSNDSVGSNCSLDTVEFVSDENVLKKPKSWYNTGVALTTIGAVAATSAVFVLALATADWIAQGLQVPIQFTTDALKLFLGFNTSDPLITISFFVFLVAAAAVAMGAFSIYRSKLRQPAVEPLQQQASDANMRAGKYKQMLLRLKQAREDGRLVISSPQPQEHDGEVVEMTIKPQSRRDSFNSIFSDLSSEDPAHRRLMEVGSEIDDAYTPAE